MQVVRCERSVGVVRWGGPSCVSDDVDRHGRGEGAGEYGCVPTCEGVCAHVRGCVNPRVRVCAGTCVARLTTPVPPWGRRPVSFMSTLFTVFT